MGESGVVAPVEVDAEVFLAEVFKGCPVPLAREDWMCLIEVIFYVSALLA